MTTRKTYECNFCGSTIRDDKGRGLKWGYQGLEWDSIQQVENHLCDGCATNLYKLFQSTPSLQHPSQQRQEGQ